GSGESLRHFFFKDRTAYEIRIIWRECVIERGFETGAVLEILVIHHKRRDACLPRPLQPVGIRAVRQYAGDRRGKIRIGAGIDERLQVGSAARDEDRDLHPLGLAHAAVPASRLLVVQACPWPQAPALPLTVVPGRPWSWERISPISNTRSPAASRSRVTPAASSAAATTTMPIPQLKVRDISAGAMLPLSMSQRKTGARSQASALITACR